MVSAVGFINVLVTRLFDLLFWPLGALNALWALVAFSLVVGVLMLWVFGKTSNQAEIRRLRDQVRGNLIGIRLFGDDLGLLLRLLARIVGSTVVVLRYMMVPMLVLIVPLLLILAQLNLRYGASPLAPGAPALVTVKLRGADPLRANVALDVPDGVALDSPAVRAQSLGEVAWRIRAERPGEYRLVVRSGAEAIEKRLVVGGGWGAIPALRTGKNLWAMVLYPGEPPIDSATVESIAVRYAPLPLELFGFALNWLVVFLVASIAFGFVFRGVLGVEI